MTVKLARKYPFSILHHTVILEYLNYYLSYDVCPSVCVCLSASANFLMGADIKKSCHIFKKNKNGRFIFDFFGSDPSKMDQT